jgi:fructose-1-phosphate kinase PfkB-like protein
MNESADYLLTLQVMKLATEICLRKSAGSIPRRVSEEDYRDAVEELKHRHALVQRLLRE